MTQILPSGKTGTQRYEDNNVAKPVPDLDIISIALNEQRASEETQGYSLGNNKGSSDSQNEDLSLITLANVADYNASLAQKIQTYVANNSYLEVDATSTANNIILAPRKIADITSPDGVNYAKATSLPFAYRDNLKFAFRATITNTGATQVSITGLAGLSGAIDVVDEGGSDLTGGEIVLGSFYEIWTSGTADTKKAILKKPTVASAATTTKGVSFLPKPITIANNSTDSEHDIDFTAGNAQADDGSLVFSVSALTKRIDASWVAGTNQGGLDTGTVANNTPYYIYAIYNPTTSVSDILFSASKTSPTLPSGYTKKAYIGACVTNGSANIRQGTWTYGQNQYSFQYQNSQIPTDVNITSVSTANRTLYTLTCPASSKAILSIYTFSGAVSSGVKEIFITNNSEDDSNTVPTIRWSQGNNENISYSYPLQKQLGTTNQIGIRGNVADPDISVYTQGWSEYL